MGPGKFFWAPAYSRLERWYHFGFGRSAYEVHLADLKTQMMQMQSSGDFSGAQAVQSELEETQGNGVRVRRGGVLVRPAHYFFNSVGFGLREQKALVLGGLLSKAQTSPQAQSENKEAATAQNTEPAKSIRDEASNLDEVGPPLTPSNDAISRAIFTGEILPLSDNCKKHLYDFVVAGERQDRFSSERATKAFHDDRCWVLQAGLFSAEVNDQILYLSEEYSCNELGVLWTWQVNGWTELLSEEIDAAKNRMAFMEKNGMKQDDRYADDRETVERETAMMSKYQRLSDSFMQARRLNNCKNDLWWGEPQ